MDEREHPDRDLTERESRALSRLASTEDPIVTTAEVERTLDMHPKLARDMAATLDEKGHIERMAEGQYLVLPPEDQRTETSTVDEFVIASSLVEPMYVGFWSALDHHGLVDQAPPEVHVVTTRNDPDREILGVTYQLVPLIERKFFGYRSVAVGDEEINVASVEKTLVDCADHPKYCGGIDRLARAMAAAEREGCSWETVVEHLHLVDNGAATKRIVYLADRLGIELPDREDLVANFTTGYSPLDPTRDSEGTYDETYRLQLNADPESFLPESVA